jgi:GTP pyrophosphokinase
MVQAQLEGLRKMLLAMAQDVRVVLIKLADHMQSMRYLVKCDDVQLRHDMARLTRDLFAPLANRLGVWQLKWELEDLALRILEPETYKRIASLLDEKRSDRERYIEAATERLRAEFSRARIKADVSGRPKHIYSIYNKMRRKAVAFDAVYDVRAVRVLVDGIDECYAALDVVHRLWTPLPGEFDDYIAKPKGNDYRSLHTAVAAMTASRSKSRFARSRCTSTPNSELPRTGATRRARATRLRTTRKSRGCGRSSSGKTRSRTRRSSPRGFRAIFLPTRSTC